MSNSYGWLPVTQQPVVQSAPKNLSYVGVSHDSSSATIQTGHGNLAGLADDDHTQYTLSPGTYQISDNTVNDQIIWVDSTGAGQTIWPPKIGTPALSIEGVLQLTPSKRPLIPRLGMIYLDWETHKLFIFLTEWKEIQLASEPKEVESKDRWEEILEE